jgi:hypothetical protein
VILASHGARVQCGVAAQTGPRVALALGDGFESLDHRDAAVDALGLRARHGLLGRALTQAGQPHQEQEKGGGGLHHALIACPPVPTRTSMPCGERFSSSTLLITGEPCLIMTRYMGADKCSRKPPQNTDDRGPTLSKLARKTGTPKRPIAEERRRLHLRPDFSVLFHFGMGTLSFAPWRLGLEGHQLCLQTSQGLRGRFLAPQECATQH